jgi:hypothetical protein
MSAWGKAWGASWGNAWGRMRELEHRRACPERTYLIPADDRRYAVPAEDRTYTVKGC